MKRFHHKLASACACVALLSLASCGGGGGSSSGPVSGTPTPSPSPTPSPTPTPTPPSYQTLSQLQGDRTFETASVTYTITSSGTTPGPITAPSAQAFGSGTQIKYLATPDTITFTAPGGTPTVTVQQTAFTIPQAGIKQWFVPNNNNPTDVITLFDPTGNYAFSGTWANIVGSTATYRLAVAGIPTVAGDFPAGTVTYSIRMGGSSRAAGTGTPVDSTRSLGTLQINYAARTGTFSVPLIGVNSAALGTLTGSITLAASGNGFTGTTTYNGVNGQVSGAVFGPQAVEIAFNVGLSDGTGNSLVGQGGGTKN